MCANDENQQNPLNNPSLNFDLNQSVRDFLAQNGMATVSTGLKSEQLRQNVLVDITNENDIPQTSEVAPSAPTYHQMTAPINNCTDRSTSLQNEIPDVQILESEPQLDRWPQQQQYKMQYIEPQYQSASDDQQLGIYDPSAMYTNPMGIPQLPPVTTDESKINITLRNSEMWQEFHHYGNEMLVVNNGRDLFPRLDVTVTGLKRQIQYVVGTKMILLSRNPMKYNKVKNTWEEKRYVVRNVVEESNEVLSVLKSGWKLMNDGLGLEHAKIHNIGNEAKKGKKKVKDMSKTSMQVTSQYKYIPQLTIYEVAQDVLIPVKEVSFEETQFVVVTYILGPEIKELKMGNPYTRSDFKQMRNAPIAPESATSPNGALTISPGATPDSGVGTSPEFYGIQTPSPYGVYEIQKVQNPEFYDMPTSSDSANSEYSEYQMYSENADFDGFEDYNNEQ